MASDPAGDRDLSSIRNVRESGPTTAGRLCRDHDLRGAAGKRVAVVGGERRESTGRASEQAFDVVAHPSHEPRSRRDGRRRYRQAAENRAFSARVASARKVIQIVSSVAPNAATWNAVALPTISTAVGSAKGSAVWWGPPTIGTK